ncbi:glycosyltransferase [Patescibacteria group bacterium]|nr:glycosyltransferase [Patescibacteria group bacterium]
MKSIIYVNYSPYENSGKILDYLLENSDLCFLFSLGFHNLKEKKKYNKLSIFSNGKLSKEFSLFQLPSSQKLLFISLPVRSFITFIQILIYTYWLKGKYGKIDTYFTVNAFTAWAGNIMKRFGLVSKTIFWVWDFYPPIHDDKIIMLMRQIYWQFDKISSHSDRVVFVNQRLLDLRKDIGIIPKNVNYPIIPIGTDKFSNLNLKDKKNMILGFIGVVKRSTGLDIVFNNANQIIKDFPNARFEVIGSGPDIEYFKSRAKNSVIPTTFHGYLEGESFNQVLGECSIGIAPYLPDPSNVSHYGDAGKVKRYLSLGLPVIITDIFEFAKEIDKNKAGEIIKYDNPKELIKAIGKVMLNYKQYQKNALKLGGKLYYKKIYPEMFKF